MPQHAEQNAGLGSIAASGTYLITKVRPIVTGPSPLLATRIAEEDPCDPALVALADVLVATMRASSACVGIAAPQVGERRRLFCMDVTGHTEARSCAGLVVMVNPRIVARTHPIVMRESCLSVPHLTANVSRAEEVLLVGLEPGTGRLIQVDADGIEARCIQHEMDHLDGKLFVDRVLDPSDLFVRKSSAPAR